MRILHLVTSRGGIIIGSVIRKACEDFFAQKRIRIMCGAEVGTDCVKDSIGVEAVVGHMGEDVVVRICGDCGTRGFALRRLCDSSHFRAFRWSQIAFNSQIMLKVFGFQNIKYLESSLKWNG